MGYPFFRTAHKQKPASSHQGRTHPNRMTRDSFIPAALQLAIVAIRPAAPETAFRAHLDTLTKPAGSLGRLEDLAVQLRSLGIAESRKAAFVFAADHGLAQERVSAYPAEVTRQMVANFLSGGAAINVLARLHGAQVRIVNCGVAGSLPDHPALTSLPVRPGSRNSLVEPAMSEEEFEAALAIGLACAAGLPFNLVAVGEMGIGNTSSASLLTAAVTGRPIAEVTGRGTGLTADGHARKVEVLTKVSAFHQPHCTTHAQTLRRLGGLEIAAMTGFMLGAAAAGSAILVDGFISTAAAAFALAFAPQLRPYLFAAHRSQEPGHRVLLDHLGLEPILALDMRLGEGTGAVLAMPILESALALYREMATFTAARVSVATEATR